MDNPAVQQAVADYARCNGRTAAMVARQPGEITGLALAARGMCAHEELALHEATLPYGSHLYEDMRKTAFEANVANIVKARQP